MEEWTTAFKEGQNILKEIPGILQLKEGDIIDIGGESYFVEESRYNLDFHILVHFVSIEEEDDEEDDDDWV